MKIVIKTINPAPNPMIGHFCEFMKEKIGDFWTGASMSLLLINSVLLSVTFFHQNCP